MNSSLSAKIYSIVEMCGVVGVRDLAQKLKKYRTAKRLSVRDLAKMAGVSVSYIYAIESGARGTNFAKLEQIAAALEIPLSALWGDVER